MYENSESEIGAEFWTSFRNVFHSFVLVVICRSYWQMIAVMDPS